VAVYPIGEIGVPDARHAVADHAYGGVAGAELEAEVDAVEERERRAEGVPDGGDGRRAVRCEGLLDVREDRGGGPARAGVSSGRGRRKRREGGHVLGLFGGEAVVYLYGGGNTREEGRVQWSEEQVGVRQVGQAGAGMGGDGTRTQGRLTVG